MRVILIGSCDDCPRVTWLDQSNRPGWGWWRCNGGFKPGLSYDDMRALGYDNAFLVTRPRKRSRNRLRDGHHGLPSPVTPPRWCPLRTIDWPIHYESSSMRILREKREL